MNMNTSSKRNFRTGQNYWINPSYNIQRINGGIVCKCPKHMIFDSKFVYNVCHAKSDEDVIRLCNNVDNKNI